MNLKILKVRECKDGEAEQLDRFICGPTTNGEFINTVRYLSYHPDGRFADDSIYLKDVDCGEIRGAMMAACLPGEPAAVISHPGTTFAGPVFDRRASVKDRQNLLEILLEYYEERYREVTIKPAPVIYQEQPMELLTHLLLQRGYRAGESAVANVIDLRELKEADVEKLYTSGRRNHIKKAVKKNLYEVKCGAENFSGIWAHLNENLYQKFGSRTTHTYEEIRGLRERFPDRILPCAAERMGEEYGAFALVYRYKRVFHTQYLDTNYQYSAEYPNLLLMHALIGKAVKEGYSWFSFGASTEEQGRRLNEGLYNYKDGFGGGEIILPLYRKVKEG